jgi:hypothetical protein
MLVGLQCRISEAVYKNSHEKKKKPRRVLNLHCSLSKSNTLLTALLWTALARGKFPLHISFERTLTFLTLGVGAMLFVRSPITEQGPYTKSRPGEKSTEKSTFICEKKEQVCEAATLPFTRNAFLRTSTYEKRGWRVSVYGGYRSLQAAGSRTFHLRANLYAYRGIGVHPRHFDYSPAHSLTSSRFFHQSPSPCVMFDTRREGGQPSQIFLYTVGSPCSFRGWLFSGLLLLLFVYGPWSDASILYVGVIVKIRAHSYVTL